LIGTKKDINKGAQMSHFAVLVKIDSDTLQQHNDSIADAVDALMAPYQENNMGTCPKQYMQFYDMTQEIQEEFDSLSEEDKLKYPTLEDVAKNYYGYNYHEDQKAYGYWANPDTKWDWFVIGGRFSDMLPRKTENGVEMVDVVACGDLDIDQLNVDTDKAIVKWWEEYQQFIEEKDSENKDMGIDWYISSDLQDMGLIKCIKPRVFIDGDWTGGEWDEQPVTLEQLQTEYRYFFEFCTWAVLDKDGWYTKGEMGWWGMSEATPESRKEFAYNYMEKFILNEKPDTVLVVVDCHI
jgi:hypothetical protein